MKEYVGIDIGKSQLDVFYQDRVTRYNNTQKGIASLLTTLSSSCFVVFEATGGYERLLRKQLEAKNYTYHMAHPNKVRAFAKAKGLLAKTDQIDAELIAHYGEAMQVEATKTSEFSKLQELLKRRSELLRHKHQENCRLDKEHCAVIIQSIKKHIDWIEKELEELDKHVNVEQQNEELQSQVKLLESIPCIGKMTALSLVVYMPEMGQATPKQLAALAGLAPMNRDSGQYRGKRFTQAGRSHVRKALYMSAVAAIRFHPELSVFYQRLRAKGKPAKVALVALMRKLLTMAAAVFRRKTPWQKVLKTEAVQPEKQKHQGLSISWRMGCLLPTGHETPSESAVGSIDRVGLFSPLWNWKIIEQKA